MILIADSGSTKTDWRMIASSGEISQARTVGFNPYFQDADSIAVELVKSLKPLVSESVTEVYYYGTGCGTESSCAIVQQAIQQVFSEATTVSVASDLLGAARALCGHEVGIACILGTGSNSCYYDGEQIGYQIPNLGFWLGDEGSGGNLGKTLVTNYLLKDLAPDLETKFEKRFPNTTRDLVLENAYKKPFPNRYFASFSKFLFDNRSHPQAYRLVYDSFDLFFQKYICKYPDYKQLKVHFTGSVAFYYSDILRQVANDKGVTVKNIMETPIAGLTLYHQV